MPQFTCPSVRFDLGEQAEMIRDTVAGFAAREIAPLAGDADVSISRMARKWLAMQALAGEDAAL